MWANLILTSPDGVTWTERTSGTTRWLYGITWSGSQFVAVGNRGTILTSSDGMTWTSQSSGATDDLHDVTWNGSQFVAVGSWGPILTSPDGESWTERDSGTPATTSFSRVTWGNGQFVAVGSALGTSCIIVTSPSGTNWTRTSCPPRTPSRWPFCITWSGSQFVAAGEAGMILTSPDGVTWTERTSGTTSSLRGITWSGSQFVAVGNSGTILTSPDGRTWTARNSGPTSWLYGIAWGADQFVAVGASGAILTSLNGATWRERTSGTTNPLNGVAWADGRFVAVGSGGTILTSPDGIAWTGQTSGTTRGLAGIARSGGLFAAVGDAGAILTSPDGETWTQQTSGSTNNLRGITWGDGRFVAVGSGGTILTSPDGIAWTARTSGVTDALFGIVRGSDQYVTGGSSGTILTSPDGETWTARTSGTASWLYDIAWSGGQFAAVGDSGVILTSPPPVRGEDAALSGLETQPGRLTPAFAPETTSYTMTVSNSASEMDITATLSDPHASLSINGSPAEDEQAVTIPLGNPGTATEIVLAVTAENRVDTMTYTVTVNRLDVDQFLVDPSAGDNGAIDPTEPQVVGQDEHAAFTVTPDENYTATVEGTCGGALVGVTYTTEPITADCTVQAAFTLKTYTVTPSAADNGAIDPSTPRTVSHGDTATFTVTPDVGFTAHVEGTCDGTLEDDTYTTEPITENCTVEATFSPYTVTVTASPGDGGTVSGGGTYDRGAMATVTATPNARWWFDYWSEDGEVVSYSSSHTFEVLANRDLTAVFEEFWKPEPGPGKSISVTYKGNGHELGVPPATAWHTPQSWVFILGNSGNMFREGHVFAGWNVEADGSGREYVPGRTFQIEEDVTLYAQWEAVDLDGLYLPHIDGTDGWSTQVALVNAGHDPADATLRVRNMDGTLARECTVPLPPGSRVEYVTGVDACLPAIKGYAEVETYSEDVVGFTRFAMQDTYRMSLPLQRPYAEEEVFIPYVMSNDDQETYFGLINPTGDAVTAEITFLDEHGELKETQSVSLAAGEHKVVSVRQLFNDTPRAGVETARISNVRGLLGYTMQRNETAHQLDGMAFTPSGQSMLIPHIYSHDEDEWTTILVFANPSQEQAAELTLTGYSVQGGRVGEYTVALPKGQRKAGFPEEFDLPDTVAWATVTSDTPVAGMVMYMVTPENNPAPRLRSRTASAFLRSPAALAGAANMAIIPVVNVTSQGGVFPILDQTGKMDAAIVNTSGEPAFMTLEAVDASGNILVRTDRYVLGHTKLWADSAQELMAKPGQDAPDMTGARFIRYASTRLMSGLQLNGSADPMRDSTMLDSLVAQPYPLRDGYALTLELGERSGMFPFGRLVSISADILDQGLVFKEWTGDQWSLDRVENVNIANTMVIMPAGPVTLTAVYERREPTLYSLLVESGRPSGDYTAGRLIPVRADTAEPGLFFDRWIGTGARFLTRINVPSPQVLMPRQDVLIEATYTDTPPTPRELEVIRGRPSGKTTQPAGRVVRIFAQLPPTLDQMFDKWAGDASFVANPNLPETRMTMPDENIVIEATFKEIPVGEFTLTVRTSVPDAPERVSPAAVQRLATYQLMNVNKPGDWVRLEAPAPPEGLVFDVWTGQTANVEDVTNPSTRLYMPDHNLVVAASYKPIDGEARYSVTYDANQGENPPVDQGRYLENAVVTVQDPGDMVREDHAFLIWNTSPDRDDARIDAVDYSPGDTFAMPADGIRLHAQWIGLAERESLVTDAATGCFRSGCHTPRQFDEHRRTRDEWEAAIDRMIADKNLVLDDRARRSAAADYLAVTYGPHATYTLTVNNGTGSGEYIADEVVDIQANDPAEGKTFDKWTGDVAHVADVNSASTTLTMPAANAAVTATYKDLPPDTYELTVHNGSGSGQYAAEAVVPIQAAAPPVGETFDKWTGDVAHVADVNSASTTLTMPAANVVVTATYKDLPADMYDLTVHNGTGDGEYEAGTVVNIQADAPAEGKTFDKWTGDTAHVADVNSASTRVTMPATNVVVTATYKDLPPDMYDLTVVSGVGGGEYEAGAVVAIFAVHPPQDKVFDKWDGDTDTVRNVEAPNTTLTMPAKSITVTATYVDRTDELFELSVDRGSGDGRYQAGRVIAVAAELPGADEVFDKWEGDTARMANPNMPETTLLMPNQRVDVEARFLPRLEGNFNLAVTSGTGSGEYPAGRTVRIEAESRTEETFDRWSGDTDRLTNVNLPLTSATMPAANIGVQALYRAPSTTPRSLTIELVAPNAPRTGPRAEAARALASITQVDESLPGQWVPLQTDAVNNGYVFDKWTGQTAHVENVNLPSTRIWMPDHDVSVVAEYHEPTAESNLTVNNGRAEGEGTYLQGTEVAIIADTPEFGMVFDQWEGQTAQVADISSPTTTVFMPAFDITVTATYKTAPDPEAIPALSHWSMMALTVLLLIASAVVLRRRGSGFGFTA